MLYDGEPIFVAWTCVIKFWGRQSLTSISRVAAVDYRVAVVTDEGLPGWTPSKHNGIFSLGLQMRPIILAALLFALIICLSILWAEPQVRLLNRMFSAIYIQLSVAPWRKLTCSGNWTQLLFSVKWLSPYIAVQISFCWNAPGEEGRMPLGDKMLCAKQE